MLRRILKNRNGTAEIVGTVLFLVILFFFFSNVFLWHNQVTREMDQVIADRTNSAVRIEATALPGSPVVLTPGIQYLSQGGHRDYKFGIGMNKKLIADLYFSIYANITGAVNESCFVQILDSNHIPVNTGLMVMNGPLTWSNMTLSSPSNYIDEDGYVTIRIVDVGFQSGGVMLNVSYMAVSADQVTLEVSDLGGLDVGLSRLWIVDNVSHTPFDLESRNIRIPAGSHLNIVFTPSNDTPDIVISYVPPSGQTVTFRILTTLGNTAACSYQFP